MRNLIRRRWVWSIILIIVLILSIILLFTQLSVTAINNVILNNHFISMDFLKEGIDRRLVELEQIAIQLEINNQNTYLRHASSSDDFTSVKSYAFTELFRNAKLANEFIDDIYIYYPQFDYVVGSNGVYNSRNYFQLGNSLSDTHYDAWVDAIKKASNGNFILQNNVGGKPTLYFAHQMPSEQSAQDDAILIAKVNRESVLRISSLLVSRQPNTLLTILDKDNNVYASLGDESLQDKFEHINIEFNNTNDIQGAILEGGYVSIKAYSEHTDLRYYILSSAGTLLKMPYAIQKFSYFVIVGCLILGIILSVIISIKHNRPIEKIAAQLFLKGSVNENENLDYNFIEQRVDEIISQNIEMIQRNIEQSWILKEKFLNEVVFTSQEDDGIITRMASFYGLYLENLHYRLDVICFSFDDKNAYDNSVIRKLVYSCAETFESKSDALVIPALINNRIVLLLNYESADKLNIDDFLFQLSGVINQNLQTEQSEEFDDCSRILFEYEKIINKIDNIDNHYAIDTAGVFAPIPKERIEEKVLYKRWKKTLELKEYEKASKMCNEILNCYILNSYDDYTKHSRKYSVINDVLECVFDESLKHGKSDMRNAGLDFNIGNGYGHLAEDLSKILVKLEEVNGNFVNSQQNSLGFKIKKIIDENFNQPYLGLYYISDILKVSTSYISKIFKDEYDIGITHYMNNCRINYAKEQIAHGKKPIKEIAQAAGFTSDIHFIRVFKQYEGITPGAYRKFDK